LQTGTIDSPLTDDPSRVAIRQELNFLLLRSNSILARLEPILAKLVCGGNDYPGALWGPQWSRFGAGEEKKIPVAAPSE